MAYSDSFPATRPVFQANFANGGRIDPRISYSRSTTGTYFGTEKVLSSENLLLQSQDFDTSWAMVNGSAPSGSQSAPDGTSTAWLLTANTGSSQSPRLRQAPTLSATTEYTLTVCLKAGTASHGFIAIRGQSGHSAYALIDFSAGTASSAGSGFSGVSNTVTALGASWFKLSLTATTNSSLSSQWIYIGPSDGTAPSSAGYPAWNTSGETMYAWGAQLNTTGATVYDSPTTTQIAREYQTKLQTAAINAPRFEYSASDSASMGLLVESQFEQHMLRSEELDNASWTVSNGTVQANAGVAPDGTLSADLLVEAAETSPTTNTHNVRQQPLASVSASTSYTSTIFAKAAGRSHAMIYTNIGGANTYGIFSLSDGSVTTTSGGGSFSSTSCGNGWYRLQMTFTTSNTNNGPVYFYTCEDGSTFTYTGNGYGSVLLWGANLTQSSHAYSYLKAEGSATTKAADSASMDLTQAGFNGGAVSIVGEFAPADASVGGSLRVLSLSDGSDTENIRTHMNNSRMYSVVRSGAANTAVGYNSNTLNDGEAVKFGLAVDTDSLIASTSGFNSLGTTGAVLPDGATRLGIAQNNSGAQTLDSHWKSIRVYGEPLSLTNLQALTS